MISIIIPYRDNEPALRRLLISLPEGMPVFIADDCSEKPLQRLRHKGAKIVRLEERGYFSGAVNAGINRAKEAHPNTDYLILNQDIWFDDDAWVERLEKSITDDIAIAGDGVMGHPAHPKGYVQGTFMYLNHNAVEEVGMLDEKYWPLWGATAEWQLRACRRGWKAVPMQADWFRHERTGQYGSSIAKLLEEEPQNQGLYVRTPPLISVVTGCYNYGRFLKDWLASLMGGESTLGVQPGQTFQGFEAIMVDDASTDNSWNVMRSLADPWKGIRAIRRPRNGGTAAGLNTAIRHAYGRYIMVLDADDMLAPTALETFLGVIEKDPSLLVYSDYHPFTGDKMGEAVRTRGYDFPSLLQRNMVPSGTMFTKVAWREAGGYPERFAHGRQDWAFAIAMGATNHCGSRIPQPLYWYRREAHNRSLTNTSLSQHQEWLRMLRETFPRVYGGDMGGCCGGRRSLLTNQTLSAQPLVMGSQGLTLMEYTGDNVGRTTLKGAVTGQHYVVKGSKRRFYADNRDVDGLLDYFEDRKYVIRAVSPSVPVDPMSVPEEVVEA